MWTKVFADTGRTFGAIYAAEEWLRERGYSVGSMCGSQPIGVMIGGGGVSKWRYLTPREIAALDGRIECEGRTYREGTVTLTLKVAPAPEADHAAVAP